MKAMTKPSPHPDETTLLKELKDIKKRLQALEGQTRLESASIGRGGLTIKQGGELKVVDQDGSTIGWIGYIDNFADPDGNPQSGMAFYRNDSEGSTLAMSLLDWNATDDDGFHQVLRWQDHRGHIIVEDAPSGYGLNAPNIPLNVYNDGDGYEMYGRTGHASTEGVDRLYVADGSLQHPKTVMMLELTNGSKHGESPTHGGLYEIYRTMYLWNGESYEYNEDPVPIWSQTFEAGSSYYTYAYVTDEYPFPPTVFWGGRIEYTLKGRIYGASSAEGRYVYGRINFAKGIGQNINI